MQRSVHLAIFAGIVMFAGLIAYLPGLNGPLFFDDKPALTGNELVKIDGTSFDGWRTAAFSSNSGPLRRPIAMLSFAANHALAGDFSPFGLKFVNLAIHLTIAGLLYFLFRNLLDVMAVGDDKFSRNLVALLAAGIWLLHPLYVSTVLYTVQRMAQLSALFVVGGLLLFSHYRARWAERGACFGEMLAATLWLLLLTVLATLSKENGVLLPWLAVVLEVCVFRGVWAGQTSRALQYCGWILLALPLAIFLLVIAISPELLIGKYAGREFTPEQRVLTQGRLLWRYLGWIFLPNINDMGFQHDDIPLSKGLFQPLTTLLASVAWMLALGFAFWWRQRCPLLLLGLLFYLVGHSLESGIYPLEMVYEHRNYLPGVMVCLAIAAGLVFPAARSAHVSVWYPAVGVVAILTLLLIIRVQTWSDEFTLSRTNVAQHPESPRSNFFYANSLLRRFEHSEELGISAQERAQALVFARHYFERMYQIDDRQVGALVMLYYLDSLFFPELQQRVDWFEKLQVLVQEKILQASDWNALATLIECVEDDSCKPSPAQMNALLDTLSSRYPRSVQVLQYRYRYLQASQVDSAHSTPLIEQAQAIAPATPWIYSYLLTEYAARNDLAQTYEYARLWLLNDRARYSLPQIKGMFFDATLETPSSDD